MYKKSFLFILLMATLHPFLLSAQNLIPASGNVGIGTTAPAVRLSIYGAGQDSAAISLQSGTDSRFFIQQGGAMLKIGGITSGTGVINILNTGRVGIGTATPAAKLDVDGDFRLGVTAGGTAYSIGFTRPVHAQIYGTTATGLALGGDANGVDAAILPNGNVGIGTVNPTAKLDVQNGSINIGTGANIAYKAGDYLSMGNSAFLNFPYIAFNATLTTSDISASKNLVTPTYNKGSGLVIRGEGGNSGLHFLQRTYNSGTPPYDLASFTEVFTLTSSGTVGIGTPTTGVHKLAVEGSIGARKVKVNQTGWADFVFQPDYTLLPLHEVEAYIKTNQHLPDIPAAAEVEKEGLDLGEMDKKLLQKVEELTLYLIDMKKEINQLKAQNESLQQQINSHR